MKVLLVEDQLQYVPFIVKELETTYGHEVIFAGNPRTAREQLGIQVFDVVVADLFYDDMLAEFNKMQGERNKPTLTSGLIRSGLSIASDAQKAGTPTAIWTSAEPTRRLHLIFAHSSLKVRAFCSKSSLNGTHDLHKAIQAAATGQAFIDPTIQLYLPPPGAATLETTILSTPESKRAMWRALALGASNKEHMAELVGIDNNTARNQIGPMHDDLCAFDPGFGPVRRFDPGRTKITALSRFAEANKEFFLDEAVQALYP